jgi:microcystin-dependent protein
LLGATCGGDERTIFAPQDLVQRVPINMSAAHPLGETDHSRAGIEMPALSHAAEALGSDGSQPSPAGNVPAWPEEKTHTASATDVAADLRAIGSADLGQSPKNMRPVLIRNLIIALPGIFPGAN